MNPCEFEGSLNPAHECLTTPLMYVERSLENGNTLNGYFRKIVAVKKGFDFMKMLKIIT